MQLFGSFRAGSKNPSLPSLGAVEGPRKEDDMSAAQEEVDTMPKVCISPFRFEERNIWITTYNGEIKMIISHMTMRETKLNGKRAIPGKSGSCASSIEGIGQEISNGEEGTPAACGPCWPCAWCWAGPKVAGITWKFWNWKFLGLGMNHWIY